MANRRGKSGNNDRFYFLGLQNQWDGDCNHKIKRLLLLGKKAIINLDSILKSRNITKLTKFLIVKAIPSSHVCMWELDHKESWVLKNWCFWTVVLEKTLGRLKGDEVNPKGNQPWIFIGRTDAEVEAPVLWPPDVKSPVQFNHLVISDSSGPHGLQHTRLPCPSPISGAYSDSCPLSQWCHPTISFFVIPFSSCHQSFQYQGLFQWASSSHKPNSLEKNLDSEKDWMQKEKGPTEDEIVR